MIAPRPFNLVRWFSVLSFGTLAVTTVVTAILLSRFIEDRLLTLDAETARDFVQSVTQAESAELLAFVPQAGGLVPAGLAEFFAHVAGMPEMVRTNVYGRDGSVLWSSDASLVARRFSDNDELDEALAGTVVYKRGYIGARSDDKPEHVALTPGTLFIESYIPIYGSDPTAPVAVVELYKAARKLDETLHAAQWLVWSSATSGGLLLFVVLQGIIRRAAAQLSGQQARLLEAETMAAVGEMGSTVAHGIRNPLASIRSSAELALDLPDCNWREQADAIVAAADRIEASIRDLLSFSRPPGSGVAPVAVNRLATEAVDGLQREFQRKGVLWRLELDPSDPQVLVDPGTLRHLLASLVVNGLEAIAGGGTVVVSTSLSDDRRRVSVAIRDTGSGISPQQMKHVMRPFYTSKPQGLGLGLPLAKRVIERLGGTFAISSEKGKGTTVDLTLPVATNVI
jgi:signal transduction histidine kinase